MGPVLGPKGPDSLVQRTDAGIAAVLVDESPVGVAVVNGGHRTDDEHVVAGGDSVVDARREGPGSSVQKRDAVCVRLGRETRPGVGPVLPMAGKGQAVFGLGLREKVDSEVVGVGDEGVGAGPTLDGNGDERRVEAHGEEGGGGEAVGTRCLWGSCPVPPARGDDGDGGGPRACQPSERLHVTGRKGLHPAGFLGQNLAPHHSEWRLFGMRLVTYRQGPVESFGVVADGGVVDAAKALGGRFSSLKAVLAAGALPELARAVKGVPPDAALAAVQLLPPIPEPDKILCVGINYVAHRDETGRSESAYPTLFTRFANTQVGHGQALVRPLASTELDYEAELAVVIGQRGRHVPKEKALSIVAGYSCYQDATLRDWQRHTSQFTPGKNFIASGGFGPWLCTKDEVPDPSKLTVIGRLNGQEVQRSGTDLLIFDIPELIAYITTFTELVPGDVISTGTPGGVGSKRKPPLWMKAGDVFEVEVTGVGTLRNPVVDEAVSGAD